MADDFHLSLSLGRALWEDLLRAALPVTLSEGEFEVARDVRTAVRRLGVRDRVKERIAGMLEDRRPPEPLVRATNRARALVRRQRQSLYRRANDLVRVEGGWRVELDATGTHLVYGPQKVVADARVKGTARGTIFLLRENVEIPFALERRVGASITLGDIRYDPGSEAIIGSLRDLAVHVGDRAVAQLLARLAEHVLSQRLPDTGPIPILRRDQVQEMVGGLGGALRVDMAVDAMDLRVDDGEMTLRVRFGFARPARALEDKER